MPPELVRRSLEDLGRQMDSRLRAHDGQGAVAVAKIVLKHYPRHLPTYWRLLEALWQLQRWEEGEEWGRRLLQADPCSGRAWRAVAQAAEQRRDRAAAHNTWLRALEVDPYQPEIRRGVVRTTLGSDAAVQMSQASLGTLYLRGYRWRHAAAIYRALIAQDHRRIDFQVALLTALWRAPSADQAYQLARHLTAEHPLLFVPWIVLNDLGDEDDRALAHNPIATLDPDGEYIRRWLRLDLAPPNERSQSGRLLGGPVVVEVAPTPD